MANPELGAKQICPNCQAKFYDLGKRPAHCPKCGTEFDPDEAVRNRRVRARAVDARAEVERRARGPGAGHAEAEDEEEEEEVVTPELDEVADEPPLVDDDDEDAAEPAPRRSPRTWASSPTRKKSRTTPTCPSWKRTRTTTSTIPRSKACPARATDDR